MAVTSTVLISVCICVWQCHCMYLYVCILLRVCLWVSLCVGVCQCVLPGMCMCVRVELFVYLKISISKYAVDTCGCITCLINLNSHKWKRPNSIAAAPIFSSKLGPT